MKIIKYFVNYSILFQILLYPMRGFPQNLDFGTQDPAQVVSPESLFPYANLTLILFSVYVICGTSLLAYFLIKKRKEWTPGYGTRLFGYWNKDETTNKDLLILNHDDYDCLDDLEKAGLVKNINTGLFPICELTLNGIEILSLLSLHKQKGKNFFEFVYTCNG